MVDFIFNGIVYSFTFIIINMLEFISTILLWALCLASFFFFLIFLFLSAFGLSCFSFFCYFPLLLIKTYTLDSFCSYPPAR